MISFFPLWKVAFCVIFLKRHVHLRKRWSGSLILFFWGRVFIRLVILIVFFMQGHPGLPASGFVGLRCFLLLGLPLRACIEKMAREFADLAPEGCVFIVQGLTLDGVA